MKNIHFKLLVVLATFMCGTLTSRAQIGARAVIAGDRAVQGYGGDGGPATAAAVRFDVISRIAKDTAGDIFLFDSQNKRIRKINHASGVINTIAGNGTRGYSGDGGAGPAASIGDVSGLYPDRAGNCYIVDQSNRRIRRIDNATGVITTVAGNGSLGAPGNGGPASASHLNGPTSIFINNSGDIFFGDLGTIRKIAAATGIVTLFAGDSSANGFSGDGGPATNAQLSMVGGITGDSAGNIFFTDVSNERVRKIDAAGIISTIAGDAGTNNLDGCPATAHSIYTSYAIGLDSDGNIYFSNGAIKRVDALTGIINTVGNTTNGNIGGAFFVNSDASILLGTFSTIEKMTGTYPVVNTWMVKDSLASAPCTLPAKRIFNVYGTIHGVPSATDSVTIDIDYPEWYNLPHQANHHRFRLPYWYSGGTYGFGSSAGFMDSLILTIPGPAIVEISLTSLDGYRDVAIFNDTNRATCSTSIGELDFYADHRWSDTILTPPCSFPATVRFGTTVDLDYGTVSATDSLIFFVDYGDGVIDSQIIPANVAMNKFIFSSTHVYSSPDSYMPVFSYVLNSGGQGMEGMGSLFNLNRCYGGYVDLDVTGVSSGAACSYPDTVTYSYYGYAHDSAALLPTIIHMSYGDGMSDTFTARSYRTGDGYTIYDGSFAHIFTMPGTYTSVHRDSCGSYFSASSGHVDYPGYGDLTIGTTCAPFTGHFYIDSIANCTHDASEVLLGYWPYALINTTTSDTTYGWCSADGSYTLNVIAGNNYKMVSDPTGTFHYYGTVGATLSPSCPATGIYTFTATSGGTYAHDFAFTCSIPASIDMSVSGFGSGYVPGDTGVVTIWSSNPWGYMCDSLSSDVTCILDHRLTYCGMWNGAAPTSISGDTLTWHFMSTASLFDFNAQVKVRTDTSATIFDTISNVLYVAPTRIADPVLANNTYTWSQPVTSSWDPNEKQVSPMGFGAAGYIPNGTPLSYMIHFQNTGTARARNITVVDTLSPDLDISTLQIINSSASVQIYHFPGNIVKFRFNDIYLPDSTTDLEGSNGYVSYNIVPKDNLPAGTTITNSASIYFDYNPGVLTNATINTIEDTLRAIAGPSAVCAGSSITLTNSISGGIWASSNVHATVVGGVVTGVTAGIDTISYTVYGDQVVTRVITVNPIPSAGTITGTTTLCAGASTTLSTTAGGSWSSSSSSTASISSTGVLTGIAAGSAIVSYTITNTCGTDVATAAITVNPLPVAATVTGGASTLCAGATTTFSASASGGVWSSSNPSRATVSGGVVTALAAGIDTIIYAVSNSCGSAATPAVITITTGAVAGTISGPTSVCVGSSVTLSPSVSGGIWSSGSIATISGGTLTGLAAGIDTVNYIVINSCGTAVARYIVTVNPLPVPGTIAGAASACLGATSVYTDAVTGGTWSSSDAAVASVNTVGNLNAIAVGTAIISYTVSNGCGAASATATVAVVTTPVAGTITGATAVCAGADTTLAITSAGGIWSSSNTTIASVNSAGNVAGIAAGSATISYTVTNICGTDVATLPITVNPVPVAGIISGPDSICNDVDLVLTGATAGGSWSSSASTVASVSATGRVHRLASGNTVISYTVTTPCGTAVAMHSIFVKPTSACNTGVITNSVAQTAIEVYPNPSHGEFTIAIPGNVTNVAIVVTDVAGRVITEIQPKNASDLKVPVSLGDVAPGTYLLRVNVDGKMYHDKLIVW